MTTTTFTRDAVLATRNPDLDGFYVTSDTGAMYEVLGMAGDGRSVFARSPRTGMLVMAVRTGSVNVPGRGAQVRVRVMFARDSGDAAGTLVFAPDLGIGGVAPRGLFAC